MSKKTEQKSQNWPKYVIPAAVLIAVPLLSADKIYAEETEVPVPVVSQNESWETEDLVTSLPEEMAVVENSAEKEETSSKAVQQVSYDYNAKLYDGIDATDAQGAEYPGVYSTKVNVNNTDEANAPTIGMPSIADQNLDTPTTESPAIIQEPPSDMKRKLDQQSIVR